MSDLIIATSEQDAQDASIVYANNMAEFISGFFAPGKGPRLESKQALLGFFAVLMSVKMTKEELENSLVAYALTHESWSASGFVKMITEKKSGNSGSAFADAEKWCKESNALPLTVGGVLQEQQTLEDLAKDPSRRPLAEAIQAMGGPRAWRVGDTHDSSFRAQFRKAYEAALSRQVTEAIMIPETQHALSAGSMEVEAEVITTAEVLQVGRTTLRRKRI